MNRLTAILACAVCAAPLLAQGGFQGPGRYEIANIKSGKVLDLDRNDRSTVIQFSSRGTDNQTWDIRLSGGGYYFIRNGMNGNALDAGTARNSEPVRGVPFNGGPSQQWRIDPGKDGNALIVSRLGKTLDIPDGTDRDGVRVQVYELNGDSNQRFTLRRASGPGGPLSGIRGNPPARGFGDEPGSSATIICSSNNGERIYCDADTRNGVLLTRQLSGPPCREGVTWGYDRRGVWVDRGCRAEFAVSRAAFGGPQAADTITCTSNNGERVFCETVTLGRRVELVRQLGGSRCREGETWGWTRRGIWVDRGCRAEFAVIRER